MASVKSVSASEVYAFILDKGEGHVQSVAENFGIPETTAQNKLVALANADLIDIQEGKWKPMDSSVSVSGAAKILGESTPAKETPVKATAKKAAAKPEAPTATEPKRRGRPRKTAEPAAAAKTPAEVHKIPNAEQAREILAKANIVPAEPVSVATPEPLKPGTKVILSDGTEGTVIADDVIKGGKFVPRAETSEFDKYIAALENQKSNASNDKTGYTPPADVRVPALPQGVSENVWFMAYNASSVDARSTYSARLFWARLAKTQFETAA